MKTGGYIGLGVGCIVVAVLVLLMAHSNDGVQQAMADYARSMGRAPAPRHDGLANLAALGLFLAGFVLLLIGAVGAGVRAGNRQ